MVLTREVIQEKKLKLKDNKYNYQSSMEFNGELSVVIEKENMDILMDKVLELFIRSFTDDEELAKSKDPEKILEIVKSKDTNYCNGVKFIQELNKNKNLDSKELEIHLDAPNTLIEEQSVLKAKISLLNKLLFTKYNHALAMSGELPAGTKDLFIVELLSIMLTELHKYVKDCIVNNISFKLCEYKSRITNYMPTVRVLEDEYSYIFPYDLVGIIIGVPNLQSKLSILFHENVNIPTHRLLSLAFSFDISLDRMLEVADILISRYLDTQKEEKIPNEPMDNETMKLQTLSYLRSMLYNMVYSEIDVTEEDISNFIKGVQEDFENKKKLTSEQLEEIIRNSHDSYSKIE